MTKIAVFASGNGSNLQAIMEAIRGGELKATLAIVICDRPGAYCVKRAEQGGIPSLVFRPGDFEKKEDYEELIKQKLWKLEVEYLVLAGYMRMIGPTLLNSYPEKIINIHPSLLPLFPGKDAVGQALAAGVKESGVTIHYVDSGMDTGPIIAQEKVEILETDTGESLALKIHRLEHRLYPQVLQRILGKKEE